MPSIIIYGAGTWGKRFLHLFQHYSIDIAGFIVRDTNNPDSIEGYPVRVIKDWIDLCEKVYVILALEELKHVEVINDLKKYGFKNIFPLDRQDFWLSDMEIYRRTPKTPKMCPICKAELKAFIPLLLNGRIRFNVACPLCNSLERHRAYWLYWNRIGLFCGRQMKLLHFAPEKAFFDIISNMKFIDYYPVDIDPDLYGVKRKVDITNISYTENMFDVIICNHVLEHVPNEYKAMSELKRVLKKDGIAFINVPINKKNERTLEKKEYNTPELRLKYYGQSDHVRLYGNDYIKHLESVGFSVKP